MFKRLTIIAAACAALAAGTGQANATSFCPVKETADGFVALRAGPSPSARLVARMKAGDVVKLVGYPKGSWQEVVWWRADERLNSGASKPRGAGWVNRNLIDECG